MANYLKLIKVLLVFLFLQEHTIQKYQYKEKYDNLYFLDIENKTCEEYVFKDQDFHLFDKNSDEENYNEDMDAEILRTYDLVFEPQNTGWLVLKEYGNTKMEIEKGDYAFCFCYHPHNVMELFEVSIHERIGTNFFIKFMKSDNERIKQDEEEKEGFEALMNVNRDEVENINLDDSPMIFLNEYKYSLDPQNLEKFFYMNCDFQKEIFKSFENNEDSQSAENDNFDEVKEDITNAEFNDFSTTMDQLLDDIINSTFLRKDWVTLEQKIDSDVGEELFKIKYKLGDVKKEIQKKYQKIFELTRPNSSNEIQEMDYNIAFSKLILHGYENLMFNEINTIISNIFQEDIYMPETIDDKIQDSVSAFWMLKVASNLFDLLDSSEDIYIWGREKWFPRSMLKPFFDDINSEKEEIKELITNVVEEFNNKISYCLSEVFIQIYSFLNKNSFILEYLTKYHELLVSKDEWKTLFPDNLFKRSVIEDVRRFFVYVEVKNSKTSNAVQIFNHEDRLNRVLI
jgi:hypothetical protein